MQKSPSRRSSASMEVRSFCIHVAPRTNSKVPSSFIKRHSSGEGDQRSRHFAGKRIGAMRLSGTRRILSVGGLTASVR